MSIYDINKLLKCRYIVSKKEKKQMTHKKKKFRLKMKKNSLLRKIIIVGILLIVIFNVLRYAAYFKKDNPNDILIIIQNDSSIKFQNEPYIDDNGIVYISEADVKEYFDKNLYYEKDESNLRRYISVSDNKVLAITENANHMYVNGVFTKMKGNVLEKNNIYYFPISELEDIYNIKVNYMESPKRLDIERLSESKKIANINKDTNLKYKMTAISKTIEKLYSGDMVTILEDMNNGWVRIKTEDYDVGYVKKSKIVNIKEERGEFKLYSEVYTDFNFDNDITIEITDEQYANIDERISNYDLRAELIKELNEKLVKEIANVSENSKNLGLIINISNISNTENYYRFLRELKAYLNSNGCYLIVKNQSNLDKTKLKDAVNIII